jgi:hypothetical protein
MLESKAERLAVVEIMFNPSLRKLRENSAHRTLRLFPISPTQVYGRS